MMAAFSDNEAYGWFSSICSTVFSETKLIDFLLFICEENGKKEVSNEVLKIMLNVKQI